MMTRILLLLLLSAFLDSWAAEDKIDLKKCGLTMTCFVRKSCIDGATADKLSLYPDSANAPLQKGDCDVIIQMRHYMRNQYRVIMQVNATDSTEKIADSDISLKQDVVQFACNKQTGPTVNDAFFTLSDSHYKWDETIVICAFTMTAKDAYQLMSLPFLANRANPTLEFSLGSTQSSIEYETPREKFWNPQAKYNCNPESITSSFVPDNSLLQDEIDRYETPPITCVNSKYFIITRENEQPSTLALNAELTCFDGEYKYKNGSVITKIPEEEKVNVICAEKFCSRCAPLGLLTPAQYTEPMKETTNEKCHTVKCPKDQWMIDGDRLVMGKVITCEKDKEDPTKRNSAWYMNIEDSGERVKVTKAACFDKTVCWTSARPAETFDNLCKNMECTSFNRSSDDTKIYCDDGWTLMHSYGGLIPTETESLTCNFQTGAFNDGNATEIKRGTQVYCARKIAEAVTEPVEAAQGGIGPVIGGGVGGLILLVIIAVVVFVVIRKRREAAEAQATNKVEGEASGQPTQSTPDAAADPSKAATKRWFARDRNLPVIDLFADHKTEEFNKLNPDELVDLHLKEFVQYDLEQRKFLFLTYTSTTRSGYLAVHWRFIRMFEERCLDCPVTWEMAWRFIRVIDGMLMDVDSIGVHIRVLYRKWNALLRDRMLRLARPFLAELGWVIRPGELPEDTWMRFFVLRVLLWAEEPTICKELRRQAILPMEQLESPVRAVVWQYAVRYLNKSYELRNKYWESHVLADPAGADGDKFGTIRQHLLYALATENKTGQTMNKDTKLMEDDYDATRHLLNQLFKPEHNFTPTDCYWAFRGATEYYPSVKTARKLFNEKTNKEYGDIRNRQLDEKCKNMTPEAKAAMKKEWMESSAAIASLMLEFCTSHEQVLVIKESIGNYLSFCAPMNPDKTKIIPLKLLFTRATNYELLYKNKPKEAVFENYHNYFHNYAYDLPEQPPEQPPLPEQPTQPLSEKPQQPLQLQQAPEKLQQPPEPLPEQPTQQMQ